MNEQQKLMNMNPNMMNMNQMNPHPQQQQQPQMVPINRSYGIWAPQLQPPPPFQNPNPNHGSMKPPPSAFNKPSNPLGPRSNWKGKRVNKPNDQRRNDQQKPLMAGSSIGGLNVMSGGTGNLNFSNYNAPSLNELQHQNRLKTRKFFPKKKFNNKNNNMNMNMGYNNNNNKKNNKNSRSAPFAPRNTTSFLIRAKKSGGIASLVSPCPVTPAVLPTPIFSPSREVLVDMAKEEWGVDGYGSMKGLIRLRSPGHEMEANEDDEEDENGGSSDSDLEEHVEVERRLDHDLSRFEMIYNPNSVSVGGMDYHNVLENRVDDQDSHIAQLEEENMILKERLFLMERELGDLSRRLLCLERGNRAGDMNEEVMENESEDDNSVSRGEDAHSVEENNDDFVQESVRGDGFFEGKNEEDYNGIDGFEAAAIEEKIAGREVEGNDVGHVGVDKIDNIIVIQGNEEKDSGEFEGTNKSEGFGVESSECRMVGEDVVSAEKVGGEKDVVISETTDIAM